MQLADAGAVRGDRIAFIGRNSSQLIAGLFAAWRSGLIGVPLNWRQTAGELANLIGDCLPSVVVVDPDLIELVREVTSQLDPMPNLVPSHFPTQTSDGVSSVGWEPGEEDTALLLYTAGTTGNPKGVMLAHRSLAKARSTAQRLGMGPSGVVLAALPLFHIGGLGWTLFGLSSGAHVVILTTPEVALIIAANRSHRLTHLGIVPTILLRLLDEIDQCGHEFRVDLVSYGGAAVTPDLVQRTKSTLGAQMCQMYGLTETGGVVCLLTPRDHWDMAHLHSVGRPVDGAQVRLEHREGGNPDGDGNGEILVRSEKAMTGYWGRGRGTDEAGWFHTGDVGRLCPHGYLFLSGRLDDLIVTGGENVYPTEVEAVLARHPDVAQVAVVGLPSAEWGSAVAAFVVRRDIRVTSDELISFCRNELAGFKCPKSVRFVDSLPVGATGKVLRRSLRTN